MDEKRKMIECPACKRLVRNAFDDPYDSVKNISAFHDKRSEREYDFKCPACGAVYIFPSEPIQLIRFDNQ